eukprot:811733-Prymnesium_polylepis.1
MVMSVVSAWYGGSGVRAIVPPYGGVLTLTVAAATDDKPLRTLVASTWVGTAHHHASRRLLIDYGGHNGQAGRAQKSKKCSREANGACERYGRGRSKACG